MTPLTEIILDSRNRERIYSATEIARLVGGSPARRHGLVNRALKAGEMIRLRRGLYVLSGKYRRAPIDPFVVAQRISPGSYVSCETALSFHSWIPEAVHSVVSMTCGGKSVSFTHEVFGHFEFCRMTPRQGGFLELIERQELEGQIAFVAEPVRALMDLVHVRKEKWQGLDFILNGLRIDEEAIRSVAPAKLELLRGVYKGKRDQVFVQELLRALTA